MRVFLHTQYTCFQPPPWLNPDELKQMATQEAESEGFSKIPERFFETAHVLMTRCKEDIENLEVVRTPSFLNVLLKCSSDEDVGERHLGHEDF